MRSSPLRTVSSVLMSGSAFFCKRDLRMRPRAGGASAKRMRASWPRCDYGAARLEARESEAASSVTQARVRRVRAERQMPRKPSVCVCDGQPVRRPPTPTLFDVWKSEDCVFGSLITIIWRGQAGEPFCRTERGHCRLKQNGKRKTGRTGASHRSATTTKRKG